MTRIVLRPIGSPFPLGFFTVAFNSVMVGAVQWGSSAGAERQGAAMIAFLAFVVQLVVAVSLSSDATASPVRSCSGFATDSLGIFFIVFSVFAALLLAAALAKRALAAVLVVAVLRFLISGIADLSSNDEIAKTAAVLGFLFAGASVYTAFALVLEDARGAQVLPVGRSPSNTGDVARPGTAPPATRIHER